MELHGRNIVGGSLGEPGATFRGRTRELGKRLSRHSSKPPQPTWMAPSARPMRRLMNIVIARPTERAEFLREIANHIEAPGR